MHPLYRQQSYLCKCSGIYAAPSPLLHGCIYLMPSRHLLAHLLTIRAATREPHRRMDMYNYDADAAIQRNSSRILTTSTAPSLPSNLTRTSSDFSEHCSTGSNLNRRPTARVGRLRLEGLARFRVVSDLRPYNLSTIKIVLPTSLPTLSY